MIRRRHNRISLSNLCLFLYLCLLPACSQTPAAAGPGAAAAPGGALAVEEPNAITLPAAAPNIATTTMPPAVTRATDVAPAPTPLPFAREITLAYSAGGRPVMAVEVGTGPRRLVLLAGLDGPPDPAVAGLLQMMAPALLERPEWVPAGWTVAIIANPNPDGAAAASPLNAHGVDLSRNFATDLDACPDNDWADGGPVRGPYPESEPETQALAAYVAAATVVIAYQPGPAATAAAACTADAAAMALAARLAGGPPAPAAARAGDLLDFAAGLGVVTARRQLGALAAPAEREVLLALLPQLDEIVAVPAGGADLNWLAPPHSGVLTLPPGALPHPLAVAQIGDSLFLLDGGRLLRLDLGRLSTLELMLAPGSVVDGVTVLAPLDLAAAGSRLFVLDRAGDVYVYDPAADDWSVDWYDRPIRDTSSHYYTSLAAYGARRYLLESSYEFAQWYGDSGDARLWPIGSDFPVGIAAGPAGEYILTQTADDLGGRLRLFRDTVLVDSFVPGLALHRPRQVVTSPALVYVLDQAGYRVSALDPLTGDLRAVWAVPDRQPLSAIGIASDGQLVAAGRDRLYFWDQPGLTAALTAPDLAPLQLYDPLFLAELRGWLMPLAVVGIPERDLRMPGAPRHYRLGVHGGVDLYWGSGAPVRAAAGGVVVRADHDYETPTAELFDEWRELGHELGFTSPEALNFYRGRQIWVEHENGLISQYDHLSAIEEWVQPGVLVNRGDVIGAVGNSGSPASLQDENADAHLHFELRLGEQFLGEYLRPIETREWLTIILRRD